MAVPDIGAGLFLAWFDFVRPIAAEYRDPQGDMAIAAIDAPRFDHDADGNALGLLVEPGAELGQADRARLQADAIGATLSTVFHAWRSENGELFHRAWYSRDPQATVDACLAQSGHHIAIGAVPGFRPNLGGFVRYRGQDWRLTGLVDAGDGGVVGDDAGRALIGA